jgi:hypothetical protein
MEFSNENLYSILDLTWGSCEKCRSFRPSGRDSTLVPVVVLRFRCSVLSVQLGKYQDYNCQWVSRSIEHLCQSEAFLLLALPQGARL